MQISDAAKVMLENGLKTKEADTIKLSVSELENGNNALKMELVNASSEDKPTLINEISVIMDTVTDAMLSNIIFDVQNGELVMNSSCSCDSGCASCGGGCGSH